MGISSNLGCDSAPTRALSLSPLIPTLPVDARRAAPRRNSDSVRFGRLPSQICLGGLLPRIYAGLLNDPGRDVTDVRPDREFGSNVGVLDGHQGKPYVLLQPRRVEGGGNLPDLRTVLDDLQIILYVPYQRIAIDLDPDHLAADPFLSDALQCLLTDEVCLLIQLHRVLQPYFVRIQEGVIAVEVVVQRYV